MLAFQPVSAVLQEHPAASIQKLMQVHLVHLKDTPPPAVKCAHVAKSPGCTPAPAGTTD